MAAVPCAVEGWLEAKQQGRGWRPPLRTGVNYMDHYTPLSILGRGGYAVVHLARCNKTGTQVAIKVIDRDELTRKGKYMPVAVERELKIMRETSHSLIVQLIEVYDGGVLGPGIGPVALVMELLRGTDLQRLLMERGALPENIARAIFVQTAVALKHLHNRGIVHRDVKPGNTLVLDDISDSGHAGAAGGGPGGSDGFGARNADGWRQIWPRAKLLDLGLARMVPVALPPSNDEDATEPGKKKLGRKASGLRRITRGRSQSEEGFSSMDGSKGSRLAGDGRAESIMEWSRHGSVLDGSKSGISVLDVSKNGLSLLDVSKNGGPLLGGVDEDGVAGPAEEFTSAAAAADEKAPEENVGATRLAAAAAVGGGGSAETSGADGSRAASHAYSRAVNGDGDSSRRNKWTMLSDMSVSRRKLNMSAVGTRAFAPPEMFAMDSRTGHFLPLAPYGMNVDEYSLGSMLRYMLTGCPPDRTVADYKSSRPGACLGCLGGVAGPPIKFLSESSPEARSIVAGLTDRHPETRLGLGDALLHPWVLIGSYGPLDGLINSLPMDDSDATQQQQQQQQQRQQPQVSAKAADDATASQPEMIAAAAGAAGAGEAEPLGGGLSRISEASRSNLAMASSVRSEPASGSGAAAASSSAVR